MIFCSLLGFVFCIGGGWFFVLFGSGEPEISQTLGHLADFFPHLFLSFSLVLCPVSNTLVTWRLEKLPGYCWVSRSHSLPSPTLVQSYLLYLPWHSQILISVYSAQEDCWGLSVLPVTALKPANSIQEVNLGNYRIQLVSLYNRYHSLVLPVAQYFIYFTHV